MDDAMTIQIGPVPTEHDRTKLFPIEDLEDVDQTRDLAETDRSALRAVADWIKSFVIQPHRELGRSGPVCPFTPLAIEHRTLWLAAERSAGRSTADVINLVSEYQKLLLANPPIEGEETGNKSIVVVFPDLPATQAKAFLGAALEPITIPSYVEDGLVMGAFYEGNEGAAIYNPSFRPFQSPVPLLLIRRAVISDWKFFLNDERWLGLWARRYGEAAVEVLAGELRRLPWNARQDEGALEEA